MLQRTRGTDNRDLHAAAESRVEAKHTLLARRRRQQQLFEIATENRDRFIVRARLEFDAQFDFNCRRQQSTVAIHRNERELLGCLALGNHFARQLCIDLFKRRFDTPQQFAFSFSSANREHAMAGDSAE